ncbi:MAG: hypothetical protein U0637_01670 [Phycisphaerales bacterium]
MANDRTTQFLAAGVLSGCMLLSPMLAVRLTAMAGRAEMVYTDRAEDNDRWEVTAGIAMGAFRGIFVNLLWIRANDMKEAGKFYDAVDLAKAITRLQPRFPRVWVFHAWNLAYNISVMTKTREERWNWVNQGVQLLRDQAIPANPNDLLLHKELAWIFLHKIQGPTDDANTYYKRMLAAEWTFNLGQPPRRGPEDRDREKVIRKYADWMRTFANAATSPEELRARNPKAAELAEHLRAEGYSLETRDERRVFLQKYEVTRINLRSLRHDMFVKAIADMPQIATLAGDIDNPQYAGAWDDFLCSVRRRVLVDDYHMEPDRMVRYTEKYGPIDWRHGAAHSLYWSARGVEEAQDRVRYVTDSKGRILDEGNRKDFDFLNTDRVVAQSVQELFRTGDLYFDFQSFINGRYNVWQGTPNGAFADSYGNILDEMRRRGDVIDAQSAQRGVSPLSDAYQNFMVDVCLYFYRRGERETANMWLERLRTFRDMNVYDQTRYQRFRDLDEFAINEMKTRATTGYLAVAQITGSLMGAYTNGLLGQDPELFEKQFKYAKDYHEYFMGQQVRATSVNIESKRMEQLDSDFEFVAGPMFAEFVAQLGLDDATYVYAAAPSDLKLWGYAALQESQGQAIGEEAKESGKTFDQYFPRPDGMDAFIARIQKKQEERTKRAPALEGQ